MSLGRGMGGSGGVGGTMVGFWGETPGLVGLEAEWACELARAFYVGSSPRGQPPRGLYVHGSQ